MRCRLGLGTGSVATGRNSEFVSVSAPSFSGEITVSVDLRAVWKLVSQLTSSRTGNRLVSVDSVDWQMLARHTGRVKGLLETEVEAALTDSSHGHRASGRPVLGSTMCFAEPTDRFAVSRTGGCEQPSGKRSSEART